MRFLLRSLTQRVGRVAVAALSVTIAVAIVVSALGLSRGIRQKLGNELGAYGANVIVTSPVGLDRNLTETALSGIDGVNDFTFQLYGSVAVKDTEVELIGMDLERASGWKIEGRLPVSGAREALLGSNVRAVLGVVLGEEAGGTLSFGPDISGNNKNEFRAVGFAERGGPEDGAVMLWLDEAQALLSRPGRVSAALVRAESGRVEEAVSEIRLALPEAEVKTLRQVASAEEAFLRKIELLMALVSIVVLVTASISLSSTMTATVLERLKEIGLMKAIGGTRRAIGIFFVSEGTAIGFLGGVAGYMLGALAAMAVSKGAFGSVVSVPVSLLVLGVVLGVLISVAASLLPLLGALRCKPSVILRGE